MSERERGVEPVAEIPDWMVIRLSDGSPEREQLISDRNYKSTKIHMTEHKNTNKQDQVSNADSAIIFLINH